VEDRVQGVHGDVGEVAVQYRVQVVIRFDEEAATMR